MKKFAFTLSEILISMTIIGVIAMLLAPVFQNTSQKGLETSTAHFHSMMSQAIAHYLVDQASENLSYTHMYVNDDEDHDEYLAAIKEIAHFMFNYLHVAKVYSYDDRFNCYPKKIRNLKGQTDDYIVGNQDNKFYVLQNGNVITMEPPSNGGPAIIQVDINGPKGPNVAGRDIWAMSVYADGTVSENLHVIMHSERFKNTPNTKSQKTSIAERRFKVCNGENTNHAWQYGAGCFARFENNKFKFDY